jgi:hypothetical protein
MGIILFDTMSRPALDPPNLLSSGVGGSFLRVKRPGPEADYLSPSSAEMKECVELYIHFPIRLHGVMLN